MILSVKSSKFVLLNVMLYHLLDLLIGILWHGKDHVIAVFDGATGKRFFGITRVYVPVVPVYIDHAERFLFRITMLNDVPTTEAFINQQTNHHVLALYPLPLKKSCTWLWPFLVYVYLLEMKSSVYRNREMFGF